MPDIDALEKKLESRDAEERREAAVALGREGAAAAPQLFRALADRDWRVRKTAVEALVAIGGEGVIAGLIRTLSIHDNAGARNSAIEALVQLGSGAIEALLPVIETPDADVRKFIVDILGDIKDRRAVDALIACLTRYDQGWLDYAAAESLGAIGDERALAPLLAALGRSSLREPVLEALGKIGNADTVGPLLASLADPLRIVREVSTVALAAIHRKTPLRERRAIVEAVRRGMSDRAVDFLEETLITSVGELQKAAIALLGWTEGEASIRKLLDLLKEEELEDTVAQSLQYLDRDKADFLLPYLSRDNALVRRTVARVLGDIGHAGAEESLLPLLDDENGHVRKAAAETLGRMKSVRSVPRLLGLLEDEYEDVQESAIRALAAIGDESMLDGLVERFSSRDASMRRNIALLLGRFTTEKAVDALAFALKDEEPDVRKAVVDALGNAPSPKATRALLLAITDDDPEVRMLAAEALGRTGTHEAGDALVPLLQDSDLWVRAAAARGLGMTGGERAVKVLTGHLGSATDIFLLALVEVLGRLNRAEALSPLLTLIEHADPEVRKTVLTALSGYQEDAARRAITSRLSDPHWSVRKAAIELLRQRRDAGAEPLLLSIADSDPDLTVRQAAQEALGR